MQGICSVCGHEVIFECVESMDGFAAQIEHKDQGIELGYADRLAANYELCSHKCYDLVSKRSA